MFDFNPVALAKTIQCNVTGPALVTRFLPPSIEKSGCKAVVNISPPLASIHRNLGPISTALVRHASRRSCHLSLLARMLAALLALVLPNLCPTRSFIYSFVTDGLCNRRANKCANALTSSLS